MCERGMAIMQLNFNLKCHEEIQQTRNYDRSFGSDFSGDGRSIRIFRRHVPREIFRNKMRSGQSLRRRIQMYKEYR